MVELDFHESERPSGLMPPVRDNTMQELCKFLDEDGSEPYRPVDERDAAELMAGTAVFALHRFKPVGDADAAPEWWWMPGVVQDLGEGNRRVQFYPLPSFFVVQSLEVCSGVDLGGDEEPSLRLGYEPDAVNDAALKMVEYFANKAEAVDFLGRCVERIFDADGNFKKSLSASKQPPSGESKADFSSLVTDDWNYAQYPRKEFLVRIMTMLLDHTVQEWSTIAVAEPDDTGVDAWDTEYFLPVLNSMTSACEDAVLVKSFKVAMGQRKSNIKYVCMVMGEFVVECTSRKSRVSELGDNRAGATAAVAATATAAAVNVIDSAGPALHHLQVTVDKLSKALDVVLANQGRHEVQLKLRAAVSAPGEASPTAGHVAMEMNGNCFWNVCQVAVDKVANPGCLLEPSDAKAKQAKATMLYQAGELAKHDLPRFKLLTECESFNEFFAKMVSPPGTHNWKGQVEGMLFYQKHDKAEMRTLSPSGPMHPECLVTSSKVEGEYRPFVSFGLLYDGHVDLGICTGTGPDSFQYVFPAAEADAVQKLLVDYFPTYVAQRDAEKAKKMAGAGTVVVEVKAQTEAEFMKEALGLMDDLDGSKPAAGGPTGAGIPWQSADEMTRKGRKAAQAKQKASKAAQSATQRAEAAQRQIQASQDQMAQQLAAIQQRQLAGAHQPTAVQPRGAQSARGARRLNQSQQHAPAQQHAPGQQSYASILGLGAPPAAVAAPSAQLPAVRSEVPTVVVFGKITKHNLRKLMGKLDATADKAVKSVHQVTSPASGAVRFVLHCRPGDEGVVTPLIDLLSGMQELTAVLHVAGHGRQIGLAQKSAAGLAGARAKAGVPRCNYFKDGISCPFSTTSGGRGCRYATAGGCY